jgi:hypothetical protein
MKQVQGILDRVDRIKGLLRSDADVEPTQVKSYPNPDLLVPAQAAEIQAAYEAALEIPISINRRPHVILALKLYRLGFNPRKSYNAVPLAEWILARYRETHSQHQDGSKSPLPQSDLARAA